MILGFDGALFTVSWKEALWARYSTGAARRLRQSVERYSIVKRATTRVTADFLRHLIAAVPYKVHTVLTDNGIHFTDPKSPGSAVEEVKLAIAAGEIFRCHSFALACAQNHIDHWLTKPRHTWTNGQMNR